MEPPPGWGEEIPQSSYCDGVVYSLEKGQAVSAAGFTPFPSILLCSKFAVCAFLASGKGD